MAFSVQEFEGWLTPKQAVQELDSVFGTNSYSFTSKHTLLERLRGGMVQAIARISTWSNRTKAIDLTNVVADDWRQVSENTIFWETGDLTYKTMIDYGTVDVRRFDVRFEPDAVRAIIAPAKQAALVAKPEPDEAEQKGPRVTDPDLEAWFVLYSRAYGGTVQDTEETAIASARGMFPGKSVARDRIRTLRGQQKRGPKVPRN